MCTSLFFVRSRHLLSEQGEIEIHGRTGLFTITDHLENVEMITRLAEAHRDPGLPVAPQNASKNQKPGESERAIRAVLDAQAAAWNRGDLEGYMDGYDRSPKTMFVSGDGASRGWQTVLDRYKKSYDTREKMGTLTFSEVEITIIGPAAALVVGRWRLKRNQDEPHGRFTLLFRKTKSGWKIVHDHTSSA
jgi:beta-aspartyl-peptidase (threonine type)